VDSLTSEPELKVLDTTNICSYNVFVKMGVGGVSKKTSVRLEDLVRAIDEHIRLTDQRIEDELARASRSKTS